MYCRTAIYCCTATIEAVPRYLTNAPPTPKTCAQLLQYLAVLRYGVAVVGVMLLARMRVSQTQHLSVLSYRVGAALRVGYEERYVRTICGAWLSVSRVGSTVRND